MKDINAFAFVNHELNLSARQTIEETNHGLNEIEKLVTDATLAKLTDEDIISDLQYNLSITEVLAAYEREEVEDYVREVYGDSVWDAVTEGVGVITGKIIYQLGSAVASMIAFAVRVLGTAVSKLGSRAARATSDAAKETFKTVRSSMDVGKIIGNAINNSGFWMNASNSELIIEDLIEWGRNIMNVPTNEFINDFLSRKPGDTMDQYFPDPRDDKKWWYNSRDRSIEIFTERQNRSPLSSLLVDWDSKKLHRISIRMAVLDKHITQFHGWMENYRRWTNSKEGQQFFDHEDIAKLPDNERNRRKDNIQMIHTATGFLRDWAIQSVDFAGKYRKFEIYAADGIRQSEAKKE